MTIRAATRPPDRRPSRIWAVVGIVGELLMTVGAVLLLFVVYQLWWTNVLSEREAQQVATQLRQDWEQPAAPEDIPDEALSEPKFGDAFAFMYVPRLRDSVWSLPILGTVEMADLARGVGHYPTTQLPGQKGNVGIAGHRATHGEPFRDIDKVRVGDEVLIETRDTWYVYRLTRTRIVQPDEMWVVDPVPGEPGAKPTQRIITLTTCNPRWDSTERWIWWGLQVDQIDKSTGDVPEAIRAGG